MSDQSDQAAQDTPAPSTTSNQGAGTDEGQQPATPPAQPTPPAAAQQPPQGDPQNPPWLKERLERAKQGAKAEVLGSLGFKSLDEIAELKAARDAQLEADKTADQRAADAKALADKHAARVTELEKTVTQRCEVELATLTEAQRDAVIGIAGDDPAARLRTIDALRPTWGAAVPAAASEQQQQPSGGEPPKPAVTTPQQPPATTAPPRSAPTDADTSPPDHAAVYAQLKKENPVKAAHYLNAHSGDIYPSA